MTYTEAQEKSLTVKWKVDTCSQGEECWCRMILPEQEIKYDDGIEEISIVGAGSIGKAHAEHIVALHNKSLKED